MTVECKTVLQPIEKLQFVKLKFARCIPIELINNVRGKTFTPEQFYKYQEDQRDNPNNFLYGLIDDQSKIHGYLWAEKNFLDNSLFVNTFSICDYYWAKGKKNWSKGKAIPKVCEFLDDLRKKISATRVFWITTHEKLFLANGFKKSKNVLMEYNSD
jgi:hypothetical protein